MAKMNSSQISRRDFLKWVGTASGAALLAACTGQATPSPTGAAVAPSVAAPSTAKSTSLRYIHWWCGGDAHESTINWQIQEFQKRNPGIKIDSVCIPTDAPAKISSECSAGKCPDIMNWASPQQAEAGLLLDLTDWMNANKDRFIWNPDVIQLQVNGKMYGWSAEFGTEAPIWNTRLLEKAGVSEIPMTWEDLLAAADKLRSIDVYWSNTAWTPGYFNNFIPQITGAQAAWVKAGETGQWDTPEIRSIGAKILEKVQQVLPYTPPTDAEDDWDASIKNFITEATSVEVNGTWTIGSDLKSSGAAPGLVDVVVPKPWPKAFELGNSISIATYTMIGASAALANDPAQKEAVLKFFDFWISPEVAKRYISEAQSPMGLTEAITPELGGKLISQFYQAIKDAQNYLTTPATMTQVGDTWNAPIDAIKALHAGKSIDESVNIWITEITPK
jgi:multiple sugar transport system substrate-binding protein